MTVVGGIMTVVGGIITVVGGIITVVGAIIQFPSSSVKPSLHDKHFWSSLLEEISEQVLHFS